MAKIIAVANQKGGVGKTTIAINISACLGILDKKVLIIDSDPQANSSSGLGIHQDAIKGDLYECLVENRDPNECIIQTETPNLDILPSSINLVGAEVELVTVENREFRMKSLISKIQKEYDYIIIDCLPSLGLITINALTAADSVIIPVQCEYFSLEGYGKLKDTLNLVQSSLNPELSIEGIVLSMYDKRLRMANMVIEEIKEIVTDKIFDTVIHRNSKIGEAPSLGQPIIIYDAASKGATNFLNLAMEILKQNGDQKAMSFSPQSNLIDG
jgi:chromosome partitioning protein